MTEWLQVEIMIKKENTKVELQNSKKKKKPQKKKNLQRGYLLKYLKTETMKVFMNHMKFANSTLQILCLLNI